MGDDVIQLQQYDVKDRRTSISTKYQSIVQCVSLGSSRAVTATKVYESRTTNHKKGFCAAL